MSDEQLPTGEGVDLSAHSSFAPTKDAAPAQAPEVPTGEGVDLDQHSTFSPEKVTQQKVSAPAEPGFLERTNTAVDTAMNKALAPNPKNIAPPAAGQGVTADLKDQLGMAEESAKTLGRLGKGTIEQTSGFLKSLPGSIYHAYADPATEEEKARDAAQGSESEGVLGRAGLGTERLVRGMTDPAVQAAKDYVAGKIGTQDVLENAEPALEQGAGTVIGGELLPKMGEAVKEGAPALKEMATAPVRAASRAAAHAVPAAPIAGEMIAGFPGRMAGSALKGTIASTLEKGTRVGLPEMESKAVHLENKVAALETPAKAAQAEVDSYSESVKQGEPVPEAVTKANDKAQSALSEARTHARIAREAADAAKAARKAPPEVPAAQIEAKPAEPVLQKLGEPKPAVRPMNVKGPGEVQPETFPQTPTERPSVGRGQMNLPNEQGRMGGTKMLPEAPMNLPQEVLPPERAMVKSTGPTAAAPEPVTTEATPKTNKAAATPVAPPAATEMPASSIETKPAPVAEKVAPVKPADLERQINEGLGNEPVKPGVPMKEQKFSSRPDKAMLQKSGAAPEDIEKILPLTRVELSKLAGHFDVDLGDKAIGREKVASGTKIAREDVLQKIVDAGHSPADIAKAIDNGEHLPTVSGGSQGATEEPKATGYSLKADKRYPATVGTEAGAKADTEHFANAKKELGEGASISDVAKRAQEMKDAAAEKPAKVSGNARIASDIGEWKAPPELGAFSAEDVGAKVRSKNPEPAGRSSAQPERRSAVRTAQAADDKLFSQARKELGDNATSDAITKRMQELKAAPKAPPASYTDRGNGLHEVTTGPGANRVGHLTAEDVEGKPNTVQVASHWVAEAERRKGIGSSQLETLARSLSPEKTTLLSDSDMTDLAEKPWDKFQAKYPDAVTKSGDGYKVDLPKLRGDVAETKFNPQQYRTQTNEPLTKLGKNKSPMKKMQ